ncbi:cytokinin dehydrogenase 3-like protein [Tanacetum coccineum]
MMRAASPPTHHPLPLPVPSASRRADIPEADIARQLGSTMACRVDYSFMDTVDANIRASERRTMAAIEVVNLRVCYEADVHRRERKEFYIRHQDVQRDHAALHDEAQAYHHECQRQDADDHATKAIMRIQALEAGARVDTLEDTERVTPYVVDMTVEMGKHNSLDDIIIPESFLPLSMPVTITAGNAPGKSSYANITGKPSEKKVNVRTLYTPGGNGIDVVVSVDSIRAISECFANTAYGFFLGEEGGIPYDTLENGPWFIRNNLLILKKWHRDENLLKEDVSTVPVWVKLYGVLVTALSQDGLSAIATKLGTPLMLDSYTTDWGRSSYAILGTPLMQSWGRSSYARVMIKLQVDVELKDNIAVAMPKITREDHYTCNVRVEYEWKPPRCSSCKVFGHIHEECPKNTGAVEKKTVKKHSQTSRGVPKGVEPTIEVSNSNPFDALISVDNDVEFGTNGGTTNLVSNGATSSGSSFMNINNDGEFASNTLIGEKIDKIERQICKGKLRLLDNDGNPLVPLGIVESDSEVEVVFDETTNLRISTSGKDGSDKCYGTNSLLEQWRDSYLDNHDYDLYDDDMYENHDLSEHL